MYGIGLAPEIGGPAETIDLVVVVVVVREVLHAAGNGCIGNPIPVLDGPNADARGVEHVEFLDLHIRRDGEVELVVHTGQLGDPVHQFGHFRPKPVGDFFQRDVAVLNYVMEQGGDDGMGV